MEVVIIGGLHHNTLGVLRSLGEKISISQIQVLIVSNKHERKNIISESKYVIKSHLHYVDSYEAIIPWLSNLMRDKKRRVLISCADGVSLEVISHKNDLKHYFLLPDTTIDIQLLMSKEVQAEYAVKSGLIVPNGMIIQKGQLTDWNIFPCIIKPLKSTIGGGKADIHVVKSKEELDIILASVEADSIQIQEYITKKIEYQLIGCSLNAGETIIIPGYTDIIRQPDNTNTGYLKYSPICELRYDKSSVERFIRAIGYSGLFSVEFIRDQNDTDYFLEINMRNDGNAYCVKSAGVNLPYIWYHFLCHSEVPIGEPISFDKSVMFIPDLNDFMRGVKSIGFFSWIKQFIKAESHSVWDYHDMKPFGIQLQMFFKIAVKRFFKR